MKTLSQVLILTLLFFFNVAKADYYRGTVEFTYPGVQTNHNELAAIGTKILTFIDGAEGSGFYAYDTIGGSTELLVPFDEIDLRYSVFQKFLPIDGGILIDALGELYITDGTASGTVFLHDFGGDVVGGSAGVSISRIRGIVKSGDSIYVTRLDGTYDGVGGSQNTSVWRIDLSSKTTIQLTLTGGRSLEVMGETTSKSGVIVVAHHTTRGISFWHARQGSSGLTYVSRLPSAVDSSFTLGSRLKTRVGIVSCITETRLSDSNTQTFVWRLSDNGALTKLAQDCTGLLATQGAPGVAFYIVTKDSFYSSTGAVNGAVLMLGINPSTALIYEPCIVGAKAVITLFDKSTTPNRRSVAVIDTTTGHRQDIQDAQIETGACLNNQVLLAKKEGHTELLVLHKAIESPIEVIGEQKHYSSETIQVVEIGESIWLEKTPASTFFGAESDRNAELARFDLKKGIIGGNLPPVFLLLQDDEI